MPIRRKALPIRINSYMHILWLSWRDIKNPTSGGAEKVATEIASRLVKDGIKVTLFTSKYKSAKGKEIVGGITIIRRGGLISCRLFAFIYYIKRKDEFDLIIDEINTLPFFTPFYARRKALTLIHQLAKEYWWFEVIFPFNLIGYFTEPIYLKIYKNQKTIALGASTTTDLKKLGFENVTTYLPGVDFKSKKISKKEDLLLFIGRLTPAKNALDAVLAFKIIQQKLPYLKLAIIGSGKSSYINKIKSHIIKFKLQKSVKLLGFVKDQKKKTLLEKAKIILIPAVREGWSLVATEANALGCVPVAYNVSGLTDSIKDKINGLLVKNNPEDLALTTVNLLKDEKYRTKLAKNGYTFSEQFSWQECYLDFKKFIQKNSRE